MPSSGIAKLFMLLKTYFPLYPAGQPRMKNSEVQGSSDGSTPKVTGGKAAVSGVNFTSTQMPLAYFPQTWNQSKHKIYFNE